MYEGKTLLPSTGTNTWEAGGQGAQSLLIPSFTSQSPAVATFYAPPTLNPAQWRYPHLPRVADEDGLRYWECASSPSSVMFDVAAESKRQSCHHSQSKRQSCHQSRLSLPADEGTSMPQHQLRPLSSRCAHQLTPAWAGRPPRKRVAGQPFDGRMIARGGKEGSEATMQQ